MIETTDEQREVLKLAIDIFGKNNQIDKAIEEMAELTQALLKFRHAPRPLSGSITTRYNNVIEEIADVRIMTEQLIMMFDEEEVKEMMSVKVDRLAHRLHEEV